MQELKAFVLQHQRYVARLADVLAEKDGEGALNKGPLAIDTAAPGPHEAASASTQAEQLAMEAGMVPIASSVLLMADGKIAPTPRIDVARRTSMPQNRSFTFGPFTARPGNDGDDSAASVEGPEAAAFGSSRSAASKAAGSASSRLPGITAFKSARSEASRSSAKGAPSQRVMHHDGKAAKVEGKVGESGTPGSARSPITLPPLSEATRKSPRFGATEGGTGSFKEKEKKEEEDEDEEDFDELQQTAKFSLDMLKKLSHHPMADTTTYEATPLMPGLDGSVAIADGGEEDMDAAGEGGDDTGLGGAPEGMDSEDQVAVPVNDRRRSSGAARSSPSPPGDDVSGFLLGFTALFDPFWLALAVSPWQNCKEEEEEEEEASPASPSEQFRQRNGSLPLEALDILDNTHQHQHGNQQEEALKKGAEEEGENAVVHHASSCCHRLQRALCRTRKITMIREIKEKRRIIASLLGIQIRKRTRPPTVRRRGAARVSATLVMKQLQWKMEEWLRRWYRGADLQAPDVQMRRSRGRSCWSSFRFSMKALVESSPFAWLSFAILLASAISLTFESAEARETYITTFRTMDAVYLSWFTFEIIIRMIGLGLWDKESGFFRSPWNWLDFVATAVGIIEFFIGVR